MSLTVLIAALCAPASAGAVIGADFVPFGRGDLAWVADEQSSGTLVGELDGLLHPPLTAYGGHQGERVAWLGGAAFARVADVDWSADGRRKTSASALRLAADVQLSLLPRELLRPTLWVGGGVHGVIPFAEDHASTYTEADQEDADEARQAVLARVGGYGGRAGLGGELELLEGLSLGLRTHVVVHRGQNVADNRLETSSLWYPEVGLRLQLEFPPQGVAPPPQP